MSSGACSVATCGASVVAREVCAKHYIAMCLRCHRKHDIQHRIAAAAAYRQIRFGGNTCG